MQPLKIQIYAVLDTRSVEAMQKSVKRFITLLLLIALNALLSQLKASSKHFTVSSNQF
jgi:hypothetical protein